MVKQKINYIDAGINVEEAKKAVSKIQQISECTMRSEVLAGIGGFNSLFEIKNYNHPVLVSSTDGVGTKLLVAIMSNKHDTIGIDLVAMCVNDIITCGAEPLFFLDYISSGKLKVETISDIAKGIVTGCIEAKCTLIGGETAEMPGLYKEGDYDLAGFVVGIVEKDKIIESKNVESGDVIIGLSSTGLHSNGFSLCRKAFFEKCKLSPFGYVDTLKRPIFLEFLEPTRIYSKCIQDIKSKFTIKSIANITGGGIIENLPRSIPFDLQANIFKHSWEIPRIFKVVKNICQLNDREMLEIFNMGIGMTIIVKEKEASEVINYISNKYYPAYKIGNISRLKKLDRVIFVDSKK